MYKSFKFLAIIPARGGSKRLPKKNIKDLVGKPLIAWTIQAALNSKYIDQIVVTSDDDKIIKIAQTMGVKTIKRPDELATDTATTFEVVKHTIENSNKYDFVILLQPTSPLRCEFHINEAIKLLDEKKSDAVISVCEVDHSPLWCNILPENGSMSNFLRNIRESTRSQDLPIYYRLNGAIYICKIEKLLKQKTFFIKDNILAFKMDRKTSIDIDEEIDLLIASELISYNEKRL